MTTRNVFNVELTKIALEDKKVIIGNKAKKMEGSKKALSLTLNNPQTAAESDIGSMVYVVAEVGGPLKKGASVVVDQGGNHSILSPEKTEQLFEDLGATRSQILSAGIRSVVDRAKNTEGLIESLNMKSEDPILKAEVSEKVEEVANKGQRISEEAKLTQEIEGVEQSTSKKQKRKTGLRQ